MDKKFMGYRHPYQVNPRYPQKVAYFSMEFAIEQCLKIYAGGLGFLAGSHLRSAYEMKQPVVGIGILWKYGYYDQRRKQDRSMEVAFIEKDYNFLEDTGISFQIAVNSHPVRVKAFYLDPSRFETAPLFLLTTDLPENDYLARTISHRLYDSDEAAKIAQYILLGVGGATLLDTIGWNPDFFHLNEAHALPAVFYEHAKGAHTEGIRRRFVFTTHTPENAGNEKHDIGLLEKMGYFCGLPLQEVRAMTTIGDASFDLTLATLHLVQRANAVSVMHRKTAGEMWERYPGICPIISITNAQNFNYWADKGLYEAAGRKDAALLDLRKHKLKQKAFRWVAAQTGKLFDPAVFTLVWARRFAEYKRADILTRDTVLFDKLVSSIPHPVQIIWAGKPYPTDGHAVDLFNSLVSVSKRYPNCAVMTGYELALSKNLKQAADLWLNTPRIPREASGTSGMTAAMNGAVNFSTMDGWVPEFMNPGVNGFAIPAADLHKSVAEQDDHDMNQLFSILTGEIIPLFYTGHEKWLQMMMQGMKDVRTRFESARMAAEYYEKMYTE